jgi:hypothetical protein
MGKHPTFRYGHPAYVDEDVPAYKYKDDDSLVGIGGNKVCPKCKKSPADFGGHDPCISNLPGVWRACCGHGVKKGHIKFTNGVVIKGDFHSITKQEAPKPEHLQREKERVIRHGNPEEG